MRYFLPLLFSPFAAFAGCAPGVNYGSAHIVSSNPICYVYSGSKLGGCYAYCGGSENGSVCVELPNAVPPTRGPYFSSGQECTPNDNNGPGKDPNPPVGQDGTATGGNGVVNMGELWVGQNSHADLGKGFNVVSNNVRVASEKVSGDIKDFSRKFESFSFDASRYLSESSQDLKRIANNTANLANAIGQGNETLNAQLMKLNQSRVLDHSFWLNEMNQDREKAQYYYSNMRDLVSQIHGILEWGPNNGGGNNNGNNGGGTQIPETLINSIYSIDGGVNQLNEIFGGNYSPYMKGMMDANKLLNDISGKLDKLGEGGGTGGGEGGEGGDKPCEGPLCDFTKPPVSSGSGLSSVFSEESIADVKKQIEAKDGEITDVMRDVKSVFISEELTISGTYNNDYQDIHGVKVDLSGKSNLELFFNSGPRTAIWFLAVLVAFSILMGGRKNA
ncbi:hypothetical protein [Aeromonas veronii]|uniref:hypothetical protein n=1 Tax=Aeromonas veronii TaxID=654 RepID=UPI002245581A|nr:hypothetical protein [Aeromonas veronii]MCX0427311.1 hypothetical protein [Aeromonas veronii]MCX0450227.1 hypothetical protein [Aeromonas veronii]